MKNNLTPEENILIRERDELSIEKKIWALTLLVALSAGTILLWTNEIPDVDWYNFEKPEEVKTTHIEWKSFFNYSKDWEKFVELNNYKLKKGDLEKVKNLALASRLSKKLENWETYIVKDFLVRNVEWEIFVWYIWIDWKNYNSTLYDLTIKAKEVLDQIDRELAQTWERWCNEVIKLWWDLCIEGQDKRDIDEYILGINESWETGYQVEAKDDLERTEREWLDKYWGKDWSDFKYDKFYDVATELLEKNKNKT